MKKINIICPTYRDKDKLLLREVGIMMLIDNVLNRRNLRLCIIDSSAKPLALFENLSSVNKNIIYLHTPKKDISLNKYKKEFPVAIKHCITKAHKDYVKYYDSVVSWSRFFPWDNNYPMTKTLKDHFLSNRPAIGMKRNMAIAALEETFGDSYVTCYADDDDFRNDGYFEDMSKEIEDNDFIRISKWLTCCFDTNLDKPICGVHNVNFQIDANGYFHIGNMPHDHLFNSKENDFCDFSIKKYYAKIQNIAFSPLSFEGAMHVFKTDLWKKSLKEFRGIQPISLSEDTLFFKQCKDCFGKEFKPKLLVNKEFNFIRGALNNTSLIQWTDNIDFDELPKWAHVKIKRVFELLNSKESLQEYRDLLLKKLTKQSF